MNQEEINILAAEFNLTPEGNEPEIFAKALTLCQRFKKENDRLTEQSRIYREALEKIANTQHICRMLEFRERCVFCEAKEALESAGGRK